MYLSAQTTGTRPPESLCRTHPASCGRRTRSERIRRQSRPSNNAANRAGDMRMTPSRTCGQTNLRPPGACESAPFPSCPKPKFQSCRPLRSEHKGRAAEWIEPDHLLHRSRKPIVTFAKVDRPRRDIDLQLRTRRDHIAARTARITRDRCRRRHPARPGRRYHR